jgi:branched-chain amino acid transport system ATP-binding protein
LAAAVLQAEELHAFYGKSHVLFGVSLEVGRGEVVALLGRNGVGKSTTLKAMVGLIPLRAGRVLLRDGEESRDLSMLPCYLRATQGISYVPEDRRIFPFLTVWENLRVGLECKGWDPRTREASVAKVWELFPVLYEKRNVYGRFLSGGQQQMLAIARALVTAPRVLLLDDPSQGLGPLLVDTVMDLVQRLAFEGLGILLVEQNATAALDICARSYVMNKGTIAFAGEATALRSNPQLLQELLGVA